MLRKFQLGGTHINLIPWNAVDDAQFKRPSKQAVRTFRCVALFRLAECPSWPYKGTPG